jgi:serine/threonine-protein kinase
MGVVYRARQQRPDRIVALKVISPEFAADPAFQARFERESQIAAQIEHPNVIPVYAVGDEAGALYIAMRFVVGTDLRATLTQAGRLEPQRAAAIVDQVAQALDAAHAHGLVHRDVKPSNVLVATGGGREHVYLTDFGLSRLVESTDGFTATGALVGTIDYIAPEQARGERVDARTDVYSLGCMLFHLITGTVPFPRTNDVAKLYAHTAEPPPAPRERVAELPPAFDEILARAMAKDPDDRFPSAGDLGRAALAAAGDTRGALAERSVATGAAAPAGGEPTRVGVSASRRRAWPFVAGAAAVLVAIVVVVLLASGGGGGARQVSATSPVPPGDREVGVRRLTAGSLRYTLALSIPDIGPPGTPGVEPLTMSLLAARGSAPLHVVERKRLPAPPYSFAGNSYVSDFKLDANKDQSGNVGLSWYLHPGDKQTRTCYFTVSLGGISLNGCG